MNSKFNVEFTTRLGAIVNTFRTISKEKDLKKNSNVLAKTETNHNYFSISTIPRISNTSSIYCLLKQYYFYLKDSFV